MHVNDLANYLKISWCCCCWQDGKIQFLTDFYGFAVCILAWEWNFCWKFGTIWFTPWGNIILKLTCIKEKYTFLSLISEKLWKQNQESMIRLPLLQEYLVSWWIQILLPWGGLRLQVMKNELVFLASQLAVCLAWQELKCNFKCDKCQTLHGCFEVYWFALLFVVLTTVYYHKNKNGLSCISWTAEAFCSQTWHASSSRLVIQDGQGSNVEQN